MKKATLITPLMAFAITACGPVESAGDQAGMSEKDSALLAKRLENRVASEPRNCISLSQLGQPVVYGNQTVVYSGFGRTEYLNNLPARCPGLDDDDIVLTKTYGSQLCKGDLIEPVDRFSGFSGPVCRLGAFIPYTKPKKRS